MWYAFSPFPAYNLSEAAKKMAPRECLLRLLPLLDAQKAYDDKTMDGKNNFQIQRTLLDIFYEMSKTSTYLSWRSSKQYS